MKTPGFPDEAIEYDIASVNGKIAFVIDDHHLPFSPDKSKTHVANIHMHFDQLYLSRVAHAVYRFVLKNTTTDEKSSFSIIVCPIATIFDGRYATAFNMLLADTVSLGNNENRFCSKDGKAYLISRSLAAASMEKDRQLDGPEVKQMILNTGAGLIEFSSRFEGLYEMIKTIMKVKNTGDPVQLEPFLMTYRCPQCMNYVEKIRNNV